MVDLSHLGDELYFVGDCPKCEGQLYEIDRFHDSDGLNIDAKCDQCGYNICYVK